FALATQPNGRFTVGVDAPSQLVRDAGPDQLNSGSTCAAILSKTDSDAQTMGFRLSCMGFAARPEADGSCKPLPGVVGAPPIPTYRLRRYFTTYPVRYDTNGMLSKNESPRVDI